VSRPLRAAALSVRGLASGHRVEGRLNQSKYRATEGLHRQECDGDDERDHHRVLDERRARVISDLCQHHSLLGKPSAPDGFDLEDH